jgi:AcrR family transcriptional regulator
VRRVTDGLSWFGHRNGVPTNRPAPIFGERELAFGQPRERRHQQPEERLRRLLAAATEAFARDGYTRTRVQEICRGAGVSVGTFYQHFENKTELLAYLVELAAEEVPVPDTSSRSAFEAQLTAFVRSPQAGIWRAWREALLAEPGLRETGARIRAAQAAELERLIHDARVKRGIEAPPTDDRTAAWLTLAAVRELITVESDGPVIHATSVMCALWHLLFGS